MMQFLKDKATYETIIRYLLGLSMLPYGLTKIMRTQFVVAPFYMWSEPLKDIPGYTLTWAFLGYSPWFTVLLGFLEAVPAVLILFRKTKLLGALLLFPVLLNVFLINVALDLWPSTQKISFVMLLMNIALLLFHYPLLRDTFVRIFNQSIVNIVLIGGVVATSVYQLQDYINQRNFLTGDWYNKRPDYWVEQDSLHESKKYQRAERNHESYVRYYFQPYQSAYRLMPGSSHPVYCTYQVDEAKQLLTVYEGRDSSSVMKGSYKMLHDDLIEWSTGENGKKRRLSQQTF